MGQPQRWFHPRDSHEEPSLEAVWPLAVSAGSPDRRPAESATGPALPTKANETQCQQKQEMVSSEQRMTQTTDQALPERLLRTIRHGKGMVSQGWGRHQKKRKNKTAA